MYSDVLRYIPMLHIGAVARTNAFFGRGTGPIVVDDARCSGSESSLLACHHTSNHNCGHSEDAGVICPGRINTIHDMDCYTSHNSLCMQSQHVLKTVSGLLEVPM